MIFLILLFAQEFSTINYYVFGFIVLTGLSPPASKKGWSSLPPGYYSPPGVTRRTINDEKARLWSYSPGELCGKEKLMYCRSGIFLSLAQSLKKCYENNKNILMQGTIS